MGLYERLMGWEDTDVKIPVHQFQATMGEYARGRLTRQQAQGVIEALSGAPLSGPEAVEAGALLDTVTSLGRVVEVDHVLMLAETRAPGYDTPAAVRARLGV